MTATTYDGASGPQSRSFYAQVTSAATFRNGLGELYLGFLRSHC